MKHGTNPHNVYDVSHFSRLQNVGGDRWVSVPVFQQVWLFVINLIHQFIDCMIAHCLQFY